MYLQLIVKTLVSLRQSAPLLDGIDNRLVGRKIFSVSSFLALFLALLIFLNVRIRPLSSLILSVNFLLS